PASAQTSLPANQPADQPTSGSLDEFNAWADGINRELAAWVIAPTVNAVNSLPAPLPAMGRNAFQNLHEPVTAFSKALASDVGGATASAARFAINSTVGLLGTLDVANAVGLPPQPAYFAEGVCKAHIPVGPYVVVPAVGGTTVGVAGVGLLAMVGSTAALALVSFELAMASVAVDVVATAAALENLADSSAEPLAARKAAYVDWLAGHGCRPS
ncbi:MAG TPA: MlaA family lipoprotein, partial [Azospirillaceae bacterium]|nr:MlaA family lipoprotein [Azospirillaceae bacterium]